MHDSDRDGGRAIHDEDRAGPGAAPRPRATTRPRRRCCCRGTSTAAPGRIADPPGPPGRGGAAAASASSGSACSGCAGSTTSSSTTGRHARSAAPDAGRAPSSSWSPRASRSGTSRARVPTIGISRTTLPRRRGGGAPARRATGRPARSASAWRASSSRRRTSSRSPRRRGCSSPSSCTRSSAARAASTSRYARKHGLTRYDVLIIASMIEREAAAPGDRREDRRRDLQPPPQGRRARHRRDVAVRRRIVGADHGSTTSRATRPYNTRKLQGPAADADLQSRDSPRSRRPRTLRRWATCTTSRSRATRSAGTSSRRATRRSPRTCRSTASGDPGDDRARVRARRPRRALPLAGDAERRDRASSGSTAAYVAFRVPAPRARRRGARPRRARCDRRQRHDPAQAGGRAPLRRPLARGALAPGPRTRCASATGASRAT